MKYMKELEIAQTEIYNRKLLRPLIADRLPKVLFFNTDRKKDQEVEDEDMSNVDDKQHKTKRDLFNTLCERALASITEDGP
mgnify:CR=1 FL=1